MRKNIHPKYHKLKVTIGSDSIDLNSTFGGGELLMDIDFRKHPAWTKSGVGVVNQSNESVVKFDKKYDLGDFFSKIS